MRDVGCTVARLSATLQERDQCLFPADAPALPEWLPRLGAPGAIRHPRETLAHLLRSLWRQTDCEV
ncbi:hypothetical protein DIPPA_21061 [Diplonema papillatum]|nr:hypothetical protein DIPPA_21061 [Diplonema papillatum]